MSVIPINLEIKAVYKKFKVLNNFLDVILNLDDTPRDTLLKFLKSMLNIYYELLNFQKELEQENVTLDLEYKEFLEKILEICPQRIEEMKEKLN